MGLSLHSFNPSNIVHKVQSLGHNVGNVLTGTVAPIANTLTGGLTGNLGGFGGAGGIGGLLGGGLMGLLGGGMQGQPGFGQGYGNVFSQASGQSFGQPSGQPQNLMDMFNQQYGQGQVAQTGNTNLSNQGLI